MRGKRGGGGERLGCFRAEWGAAETSVVLPGPVTDNNLMDLGGGHVMPQWAFSVKDDFVKSYNSTQCFTRMRRFVTLAAAAAGLWASTGVVQAQPATEEIRKAVHGGAADLMPAQVDAYLELHDPAQVAELFPLAFVGPDGQKLAQSLRLLAESDVTLGIDTQNEQAMLVIDSSDADRLRPLAAEALRILGELASQLQLKPDTGEADPTAQQPETAPPPEGAPESTGTILRRFGRLTVARLDRRLIVATEPAWIERAVAENGPLKPAPDDNAAAGQATLARDPTFRAAADAIRTDAPAWLFVRPSALAKLLTGEGLLVRAGQQFPALKEIVGGLLLPASRAPYLAFELGQRDGQLEISLVLPEEMRDADGDLRLLVAALDNDARAFTPLLPKETILSVSAAVSHDAVALARKLLLNPERLEKLSETSPDAAALLQGLPLIEQILAEIKPQIQLVVARQGGATSQRAQADLRLPAAAIIFHPHNPQEVKTAFITTYLGAIRNANVQAKAMGMPTYSLQSERRGEGLVTGALRRELKDDPRPGRIEYNLSPAMAVIGERYIISTNFELAQELADLAQQTPAAAEPSNLRVDVGSAALLGVLAENLPALMQGRQVVAGEPTPPLIDLTTDVLRRLIDRLPAEPRAVGGGAARVPWRVRMRARFGRL